MVPRGSVPPAVRPLPEKRRSYAARLCRPVDRVLSNFLQYPLASELPAAIGDKVIAGGAAAHNWPLSSCACLLWPFSGRFLVWFGLVFYARSGSPSPVLV